MSNPFQTGPSVTQTAATTMPKPPAPMPDSQSPAVLEAARRAQQDIMKRAGRQSTILTAPSNRGGSDSYSSTTLGAGNS